MGFVRGSLLFLALIGMAEGAFAQGGPASAGRAERRDPIPPSITANPPAEGARQEPRLDPTRVTLPPENPRRREPRVPQEAIPFVDSAIRREPDCMALFGRLADTSLAEDGMSGRARILRRNPEPPSRMPLGVTTSAVGHGAVLGAGAVGLVATSEAVRAERERREREAQEEAARPRPPQPRRLRSIDELTQVARAELGRRFRGQASAPGAEPFRWGEWVIETELHRVGLRAPAVLQEILTSYNQILEQVREQMAQGQAPQNLVENMRRLLIEGPLKRYCRDRSLISDFQLEGCGNCDAETRLVTALFMDAGLSAPPGQSFGIQLYHDHLQPVLYNQGENTVHNIVSGTTTRGITGQIFRPELLLYGYLNGGNQELVVDRNQDLLIQNAEPRFHEPRNHTGTRVSGNRDIRQPHTLSPLASMFGSVANFNFDYGPAQSSSRLPAPPVTANRTYTPSNPTPVEPPRPPGSTPEPTPVQAAATPEAEATPPATDPSSSPTATPPTTPPEQTGIMASIGRALSRVMGRGAGASESTGGSRPAPPPTQEDQATLARAVEQFRRIQNERCPLTATASAELRRTGPRPSEPPFFPQGVTIYYSTDSGGTNGGGGMMMEFSSPSSMGMRRVIDMQVVIPDAALRARWQSMQPHERLSFLVNQQREALNETFRDPALSQGLEALGDWELARNSSPEASGSLTAASERISNIRGWSGHQAVQDNCFEIHSALARTPEAEQFRFMESSTHPILRSIQVALHARAQEIAESPETTLRRFDEWTPEQIRNYLNTQGAMIRFLSHSSVNQRYKPFELGNSETYFVNNQTLYSIRAPMAPLLQLLAREGRVLSNEDPEPVNAVRRMPLPSVNLPGAPGNRGAGEYPAASPGALGLAVRGTNESTDGEDTAPPLSAFLEGLEVDRPIRLQQQTIDTLLVEAIKNQHRYSNTIFGTDILMAQRITASVARQAARGLRGNYPFFEVAQLAQLPSFQPWLGRRDWGTFEGLDRERIPSYLISDSDRQRRRDPRPEAIARVENQPRVLVREVLEPIEGIVRVSFCVGATCDLTLTLLTTDSTTENLFSVELGRGYTSYARWLCREGRCHGPANLASILGGADLAPIREALNAPKYQPIVDRLRSFGLLNNPMRATSAPIMAPQVERSERPGGPPPSSVVPTPIPMPAPAGPNPSLPRRSPR